MRNPYGLGAVIDAALNNYAHFASKTYELTHCLCRGSGSPYIMSYY